jgi:succinate dehydrogenase/fumarate reductase cytochrome b subunit
MKIEFKKPIVSSLFSIILTFLVSMIVLYVTNPSYIIDVSEDGKKRKNICLLFIYSMLYAVLVGISVLLWRTGESSTKKSRTSVLGFNPRSYNPNR